MAEQDYDWTMVEFALLLEAERLEQAQETDARYHLAKLISNAFNEPQLLWDEHRDFRLELLAVDSPDLPTTGFWATAGAMHRRMVDTGLIQPPPGVQH